MKWKKPCGNESACVEVSQDGDRMLLRDSKHPSSSPLVFTEAEWKTFVLRVAQQRLPQNVTWAGNGQLAVAAPSAPNGPRCLFSLDEWEAFETAARDGAYTMGRVAS